MKKTVLFLMSVILLFSSFIFSVNAAGKYIVNVLPDYYSNRTGTMNMIRNPYYQKYYNELLAYSYQLYTQNDVDSESCIASFVDRFVTDEEEYITLILEENNNPEVNTRAYNLGILEKYFRAENILYVSDYNYAAVVAISGIEAQKLKQIDELVYVGYAFYTSSPQVMEPMLGTYALGKVVFKEGQQSYEATEVTAADARFILRYSAGLEEVGADKQFYFCADVNMDNEINAADAREALRLAAGLKDEIYLSYNYYRDWYDIMINI